MGIGVRRPPTAGSVAAMARSFSGSGGLAGTPGDLARWLAALLADAPPLRGVLAALTAPRKLADRGRVSFYGLGLARMQLGQEELIGHGGSLPGYKNHVLLAPAARCRRGGGLRTARTPTR